MGSYETASFSPTQFLEDIRSTTTAIGAPYSEATTLKVLETYAQSFSDGAVLWRSTDRPGDALNYRFYERKPIDTVGIAVQAGLLAPDNPMIKLIQSWSSLYDGTGTPEQSCDFDAKVGLVKTWVYLKGIRPLDDVLNAPGIPNTLRQHSSTFHALSLNLVRHVAVDYQKYTANLYFRAPGPISAKQAEKYTALAGAVPPSDPQLQEMLIYLNPVGFTFSVTIDIRTGSIERVAFYALKLPPGRCPQINDQLKTFFSIAPSYDLEEMNAVAWSFGKGGRNYVKAERSYCGDLVSLMRIWSSTFSVDS